MDIGFLLEKLQTGVFWTILEVFEQNTKKVKVIILLPHGEKFSLVMLRQFLKVVLMLKHHL